MRLIPKELFMEQNVDMTLFHMDDWNLDYTNKYAPQKGISIQVFLKRKIMSEMLTTYLPSFLLLMITFATTFFKPFFFEAALSVNLTTMLVMTTIFISVMEKLPLTSYPKMIDFWLIFCQLVPFAEVIFRFIHHHLIHIGQVILLTAMEYMREETDEMEGVSTQISNDGKVDITEVTTKVAVWQEGEEELKSGNSWNLKTLGRNTINIKWREMLVGGILCYELLFQ